MYDVFGKAAGPGVSRRGHHGSLHFSPSFGVRQGFIKDPNWPPAHMPEEGTATKRRHLRVKCEFMIRVPGGEVVSTAGDLSAGGARFTHDAAIGNDVEVLVNELSARANVLDTVDEADGRYTYRVMFTDPAAGAKLFARVYWAP